MGNLGNKRYIDLDKIKSVPNKYNLTPLGIKKLKIADWDRLKKETWLNSAMTNGKWWCHLEGCEVQGPPYRDDDEFWIGFNENNDTIDCYISCYEGMCSYTFENFYDVMEIYNQYDMNVQVNAMRWLNKMLDEGILKVA